MKTQTFTCNSWTTDCGLLGALKSNIIVCYLLDINALGLKMDINGFLGGLGYIAVVFLIMGLLIWTSKFVTGARFFDEAIEPESEDSIQRTRGHVADTQSRRMRARRE
ncbi:hypothetical protein M3Y94_00085800 [Aphelenchoides besseyi]|nr:hypothetical protein M3Y94_00085800 [Aphelenchoides besseyi]